VESVFVVGENAYSYVRKPLKEYKQLRGEVVPGIFGWTWNSEAKNS